MTRPRCSHGGLAEAEWEVTGDGEKETEWPGCNWLGSHGH